MPREFNALNDRAGVVYVSHRKRLKLPTLPGRQFAVQVEEEMQRLWRSGRSPGVSGTLAQESVKQRWVEQGIWDDKWDKAEPSSWRWPHEGPPESGTQGPKMNSRRNVSRPFHQFIHQLLKVHDQMENDARYWEGKIPVDIMTRAAKAVKEGWTKQDIWTKGWGSYPGMTWMHENYPEEWARPASGFPEHRGSYETVYEPTRYYMTPSSPILQYPRMHGDIEGRPSRSSKESSPSDAETDDSAPGGVAIYSIRECW